MECFLQYWDNLDDLYWSMAAQRERAIAVLSVLVALLMVSGIAWASFQFANLAPSGAAVVCLLLSMLLSGSRQTEETPS